MLHRLSRLLRSNGGTYMQRNIKTERKCFVRFHHKDKLRKRCVLSSMHTTANQNSFIKCYSSATSSTRIFHDFASEEMEEQEDDVMSKGHLLRVQRNLLPFLDVAVNANLTSLALKTLQHYHNNYKDYGMPLSDIRFYDYVLQGFATEGNWNKFQDVMKMISTSDNLKPNLQTFVFAIECAYRAENFDAISGILEEIKTHDFDIYNIFVECSFYRDQREVVLKAIRTQIASFEPNKRKHVGTYNCEFLSKNNPFCDKNYTSLVSHMDAKGLKDLVKQQLQVESSGIKRMSRFDYNPESSLEKEKLTRKLDEHQKKWKEAMLQKFQIELSLCQTKSNENNGEVNILPYLSFMTPSEFVDLMFEEFHSINQNSDICATEINMLRKTIGLKVMDKYFFQYKIKNGILQQIMKLYEEYAEYLVNPELRSQYTPRQYWLLLKEKYSDGPDIESNDLKWPHHICAELGRVLFAIMDKSIRFDTEYLQNKRDYGTKKKLESLFHTSLRVENEVKVREVRSNKVFKQFCNLLMKGGTTLFSTNVPMVCPPLPWNSYSSGGYLLSHKFSLTCFLRTANLNTQNIFRQTDSQALYPLFDSINHIAECPWIINKKIFSIISEVYKSWAIAESGYSIVSDSKTKLDKGDIAKLLFRRRRTLEDDKAKFDLFHKLSIANEFREKVFWFPHNIDFRGRVYPITTHFHYHLTDVDRGLLLFANGEPLGKEGLDWLKIHLINLTGHKKSCSSQEKIEYCNELLTEIADSGDNPLTGNGWWQKSDCPWQTLACCIELTSALRSPNHCDYICHLPIHQDGFCNGLQHYAALGRDAKVADQVNLESNKLPKDLYSTIANQVEQLRKNDAEAGNQVAMFLDGFINRNFVKRPLMVMMYGSSLESAYAPIFQQIKEVTNCTYEQQLMTAEYLVEKMWPLFNEQFSSVLKIQNWFTECGSLILQIHDQPVRWVSPLGLPIVQPFVSAGKITLKRKNRFHVEREMATKDSNIRKHAKSFSSNFIHSLDATHLLLTSLFCQRQGITFVGVHDSFWTHANRVSEMNKICREQFVALHNQPLLETLSEQLQQQFCGERNTEFQEELSRLQHLVTQVPTKGTFDLTNVLNSPYFFS